MLTKFPFLKTENNPWAYGNCDSSSWFDCVEPGWRNLFIDMLLEIRPLLIKAKYLNKFEIQQIKEKWGFLRFYYENIQLHHKKKRLNKKYIKKAKQINKQIFDIVSKYEYLSSKICIECGKPATYRTKSWISFYCDDCIQVRNYLGIPRLENAIKIK